MRQIRHYAQVMRRWLWLMVVGVIICSSVTFAINKFLIKPVYEATALIQVNGALTPTASSSGNDVFSDQALAISDSLLVTSTDVLQSVASQIPGVSLSQLETKVSASPQASSQIIQVRADAGSAELAAKIANTVVKVFIQQQVDKVSAPLKSQDKVITQNVHTTKIAMNQAQSQVANLQSSGAAPDAIASENGILASYQANYNSLLTSQQQIQSQENQVNNALSIAQAAQLPDQASSPHTTVNTAIAGAAGLLLVIILALLLDWLDTSIQTTEDIVKLAHLEALGSVPFSHSPLLLARATKPSVPSDDRIAQAFTSMVVGNSSRELNTGQHIVLVTSLRRGAGVTTIATNLAISLARLGKHVLLIDANLGRPVLHDIFQRPNSEEGFASSLMDGDPYSDQAVQPQVTLCRTKIPNLHILPAGSTSTPPLIVEHMQELRMLTDWLLGKTQGAIETTELIDSIIFDAPAMSESADAVALAAVANHSILVVEAGRERNEIVSRAGETLEQLGVPVLGVVVNRQTASHRSYLYNDGNQQKNSIVLEDVMESLLMKQIVAATTVDDNEPVAAPVVASQRAVAIKQALPHVEELPLGEKMLYQMQQDDTNPSQKEKAVQQEDLSPDQKEKAVQQDEDITVQVRRAGREKVAVQKEHKSGSPA